MTAAATDDLGLAPPEEEDGAPAFFQSLLPFVKAKQPRARMARTMREALEEDSDYEDAPPEVAAHVRRCFGRMIRCEQRVAASSDDDCVFFYRVIDRKYVLYAFHTAMLRLFGEHTPHDGEDLICTPSLDEARYPDSLAALLARFRADPTLGDSRGAGMAETLLSVNNCLTPRDPWRIRLRPPLTHQLEAPPLEFFSGYDETTAYPGTMTDLVAAFFGLDAGAARDAVGAMFALYDEAQADAGEFEGHCLQICVPRAVVNAFAYPCVDWGRPVALLLHDETSRLEAVPHGIDTAGAELTLDAFLRRPELGELQSRLIGHPNLFLRHGARVHVHHGNPRFDAAGFAARLRALVLSLAGGAAALRLPDFNKFRHLYFGGAGPGGRSPLAAAACHAFALNSARTLRS